jgi:methionine synthase I (cobalamin-dependent)
LSKYEVWSTGGEKLQEIESLPIEAGTEVVFTNTYEHNFSRMKQSLMYIIDLCENGDEEIKEAAHKALSYIPKEHDK